jgi:hypothetical protein
VEFDLAESGQTIEFPIKELSIANKDAGEDRAVKRDELSTSGI